jgi:amino acid adenylation domain-containing protein
MLDPAFPASRLISYLEIASPKGWMQLERAGPLDPALAEFVDARDWRLKLSVPPKTRSNSSLLESYPTAAPNVSIDADDLAFISFTSGSTGKPKGVLQRHGPLTHFLPWQAEAFHLGSADRFSMLSGLSHDPLQRDIFTPIWLGARICIPDAETIGTPGALAEWMARQEITFAHLTPPMARVLTETGSRELSVPSLRGAFFVGDKLSHQDVEALRCLAPNVTCINSYGTTETQRAVGYAVVSTQSNTETQKAIYPVGRGMPNVQLLILNRGGGPAGVGELGEIYVRSPHLAKGYLGDDALTRERFIVNAWTNVPEDRMYRTGDLGRYLPDGTVEYLGRADRQLKLRGFRIEPGEIEAALQQQPSIRQALVVLDETHPRGARLVAYLVADAAPPSPRELRAFLQARIPDFMTPSEFIFIPELPLTPNGKIDTEALPPPPPKPEAAAESDVPLTRTEQKLASIWEKVLHVPRAGRNDDFFELGGHSMLAIQLFSRIEQEMGKKLPIATLFRAPTIAGLAHVIEQPAAVRAVQTLVPIQTAGTQPPFFCVHGLGGGVIGYAELARLLGPEQPFYGLQAYGAEGTGEPDDTIEKMAARYIEALRAVQPQGPYRIGGYCYGGFVAFEMASQLQRRGEQVGLLAIFEGYAIRRSEAHRRMLHPYAMTRFFKNLPFWVRDYGPLRYEKMVSRLKFRDRGSWQRQLLEADRGGVLGPEELARSDAIPPTLRRVLATHLRALANYHPPVYPGPVTLFRVRAQSLWRAYDPEMGWGRLTTGGVKIVKIPGAHYNILERPHVVELARELGAVLAENDTYDNRARGSMGDGFE